MIYGKPVRIEDVTTVTPSLIVSVSDIKKYERMDATDTLLDGVIETAIRTATMTLESYAGAVFQSRSFKCYYDAFPDAIEIPLHPNQIITKIEYYDGENVKQQLTSYDEQKKWLMTNIYPVSGSNFPDCYDSTDRVIISATAGYAADKIPDDIKQAVISTVSVILNGCEEFDIPKIAKRLISKYVDKFKSVRI